MLTYYRADNGILRGKIQELSFQKIETLNNRGSTVAKI